MDVNILNNQVNMIKKIIKNLPDQKFQEYKPLINEFNHIVRDLENSMKAADDTIDQLNNLKKGLIDKMVEGSRRINTILSKLRQK